MYDLTDTKTIKSLLRKYGFSFSSSLGQNFIIDPLVCPGMVKLSGADETSGVLEIGAGIGVLTSEIAKTAKKVVSFELDKRLIPLLSETLSEFNNITVINEDILKADLNKLFLEYFPDCENIFVIANLPYYITTPVIMALLEGEYPIESLTLMVQKETGERLAAKLGTRKSGAVTVSVDYYCLREELFFVPKESFFPSPKVDGEVIKLTLRKQKEYVPTNKEFFFKTIKAAFSLRRKTLKNSVSRYFGISGEEAGKAIARANIDENLRAENLTMKDFYNLSEELLKAR